MMGLNGLPYTLPPGRSFFQSFPVTLAPLEMFNFRKHTHRINFVTCLLSHCHFRYIVILYIVFTLFEFFVIHLYLFVYSIYFFIILFVFLFDNTVDLHAERVDTPPVHCIVLYTCIKIYVTINLKLKFETLQSSN